MAAIKEARPFVHKQIVTFWQVRCLLLLVYSLDS